MDEQEIPQQPKEKLPGNQGKRYIVAEKAEILRTVEQTDIRTASKQHHVSEGSIRQWLRLYDEHGIAGLEDGRSHNLSASR